MPNWCTNNLDIRGPKNYRDFLQEFVKETVAGETILFSFNKIIPQPPNLPKTLPGPMGPSEGWYVWRLKNWGTKWNLSVDGDIFSTCAVFVHDERLHYDFDTAWSPPIEVIAALSKRFPTLQFTLQYSEPMNGVYGTSHYYKGRECGFNFDVFDEEEEDNKPVTHST